MITWLYDFDERITAKYIEYLFMMAGFRKQIDALQAGSTVAYLSISMTKELDIMVPPLKLQEEFIEFIKQVDKSKVAAEKNWHIPNVCLIASRRSILDNYGIDRISQ